MKHHDERMRHLQQLEADLDRQIADAHRLQKERQLKGVTVHSRLAGRPPARAKRPRKAR
ncbi:MAG TPA: hypothetical protein VL484_12110 [Vicinamibacterales bacterium]|nr:hypothetical protein [Vicinamibacterales bacterium]